MHFEVTSLWLRWDLDWPEDTDILRNRKKDHVKYYLPAENNKPELQFLLVLDFEATCIKNNKIYPCPEIIEFPVIIVDTH